MSSQMTGLSKKVAGSFMKLKQAGKVGKGKLSVAKMGNNLTKSSPSKDSMC